MSDDYLLTFNEPHVNLFSAPGGIEAVTPTGFIANGQPQAVDCIIFATGFGTGTSSHDRYAYDLTGRSGLQLNEYFSKGTRSLHGFYSHHCQTSSN